MAALTAAVYVRVSDEDKQEDSPERQADTTSQIIKASGYRLSHPADSPYLDLDLKGWDENRPGLLSLIRDARAGRFKVVVVDDWSRISRMDLWDTAEYVVNPLRRAGVVLHTAKDGLMDWDEVATQMRAFFNSFKNSEEVKDLSRRVLTGLAKRAKKADVILGPTPYGMRAVIGPKGKRSHFEPADDITTEVVRRIFRLCVERNMGLVAIASSLTADGVPSPRGHPRWSNYAVQNILKNRVYVGDYVWNKLNTGKFYRYEDGAARPLRADEKLQTQEDGRKRKTRRSRNAESDLVVVNNHHGPVVDRELFAAAQAALKGRRKKANYTHATSTRALSGLLVCGACGAKMYSTTTKGKTAYRCGSSVYHGVCKSYALSEARAVGAVFAGLRSQLLNPEFFEALRERARQEKSMLRDAGMAAALQSKIARLSEEIAAGYDAALDPVAKKNPTLRSNLLARVADKEAERERMTRELENARTVDPVVTAEQVIERVQSWFWRAEQAVEDGRLAEANAALRTLVDHVELRFETRKTAKSARHTFVGGTVFLRGFGCVESAGTGPSSTRSYTIPIEIAA